jgi:hypothetical protein
MTFDALRRVPWLQISSWHMDELRRLFGGRCRKCGAKRSRLKRGRLKTGPLEFAHVKPTGLCGRGRGLKNRFVDVLRNPDCYELLCHGCHHVLDMRKWIDAALASAPPAERVPA